MATLVKIKQFWYWVLSWFVTYHNLSVSYNSQWGDSDDQHYVVRKFYKKQPNFLRFKTQDGEIVELRGADGLNYRIEEI